MCGIAGLLCHSADFPALRGHVENILNWQTPRGPDHRGYADLEVDGLSIRLGHNRLSIIDLSSAGHQPMADSRGDLHITYNGEIYNYIELRAELSSLGVRFESNSDTEVVLEAWKRWGESAIGRFNGMFAFAIFDRRNRSLTLVRDRFGVKPLFWAEHPDFLIFASSAQVLARIIGSSARAEALSKGILYKQYESATGESWYQGIKGVAPGTLVRTRCDGSGTWTSKEHGYYSLDNAVQAKVDSITGLSERQLATEFLATLDSALAVRLRADVPVALSLSGGLDSSTLAALIRPRLEGVRGFSYAHPQAVESEGPLIDVLSRYVGLHTTYVWPHINAQFIEASTATTLRAQEAPFSGISVIAQNLVYKSVRESGYRVLIGGQGADEILCGYRKFFIFALLSAARERNVRDWLCAISNFALVVAGEFLKLDHYWGQRYRYLNRQRVPGLSLLDVPVESVDLGLGKNQSFRARQIADVMSTSLPTLLRYEDRNSMSHSVESRLPFMDFRLVELSIALPLAMKLKGGYGKWMLRNCMLDKVPDSIRWNRVKRGFDVSQDWIRGGLGNYLRNLIRGEWRAVQPYVKHGIGPDNIPGDGDLANSHILLDETLALAWLAVANQ